jgi:hypothetical protein
LTVAGVEALRLAPRRAKRANHSIPVEPDCPDPLSSVAVIWYQDVFGMPDEAVMAQMRAIDWRRHAQPWDW